MGQVGGIYISFGINEVERIDALGPLDKNIGNETSLWRREQRRSKLRLYDDFIEGVCGCDFDVLPSH